MVKFNGGIKGVRNSAGGPTGTNFASGLWGVDETTLYVKESNWPRGVLLVDFRSEEHTSELQSH